MITRYVKAGSTGGTKTRVFFRLFDATDYVTPETGEAGGQPQISTNGAAWTNTGIGTLTSIGSGWYYADLTTASVVTAGSVITSRYKSSNTAEAGGTTFIVTALDPFGETQTVSLGTSTIGSSQIVDGAFTAAKFGTNFIGPTSIADNTFLARQFVDGLWTAAKFAASVFTSAKFANGWFIADHIASGALTSTKFDASVDVYTLSASITQVDASTQEHVVFFTKNTGALVTTSTITGTPTITLTKSDGTVAISAQNLTPFGSTGSYKYQATGGALLDAGECGEVVVTATIDGVSVSRKAAVVKNNNA